MGLFSRPTQHTGFSGDPSSAPSRPRPWVRPEFLAVFIALVMVGGGLFLLSTKSSPAPSSVPADTSHTEYVSLADLQGWTTSHPQAHVLSSTPVYENGVLVGYMLRYED